MKRGLSLQKSADGIVPEKKSGRPEHEDKGVNGKYKRMRRVQKIQKKWNHLWEETVNSVRACMRGRANSWHKLTTTSWQIKIINWWRKWLSAIISRKHLNELKATGENKDLWDLLIDIMNCYNFHEPPYAERHVRWCERTGARRPSLLDSEILVFQMINCIIDLSNVWYYSSCCVDLPLVWQLVLIWSVSWA
jgi:hypothetical protein